MSTKEKATKTTTETTEKTEGEGGSEKTETTEKTEKTEKIGLWKRFTRNEEGNVRTSWKVAGCVVIFIAGAAAGVAAAQAGGSSD